MGGGAPHQRRIRVPITTPFDVRTIALGVIALVALLHTLHYAVDLLMPIVLALLGRFTLSPVVRRLGRAGLPAPLGAALIVGGLAGLVFVSASALSGPAATWLERAPANLRQIEEKVRFIQRPVQEVVEATEEVADAASGGGDGPKPLVVEGPSLLSVVMERMQAFVVTFVLTATLLLFMLASGDGFAPRLAAALSGRRRTRGASEVFQHIERSISRHLLTITAINVGLGLVVALAMSLLGMPSPMLWGALAGVLNFVPFLGALVTAAVVAGVALMTFEEPLRALLVTSVFLSLTTLEGLVITPALLGRRLTLGPTSVLVAVLVGSWLWGVVGAIIAVPVLAALRILCEHVEPLGRFGALLGRPSASPPP